MLFPFPHLDKNRVMIFPLPRQNVPIVKSRRLTQQVPLADHRRLIPAAPKQLRKCFLASVKWISFFVVIFTVNMAVLSRQYNRPAWRTYRVRTKAILKPHPVLRDPVQIWRGIYLAPVTAKRMRRVIVGHYKNNIRPIHFSRCIRTIAVAKRSKQPTTKKYTPGTFQKISPRCIIHNSSLLIAVI
jgi:hypothetical protein